MIGTLVVSHGQLAQELVAAAEMIVGEISHIQAVSIGWHDDVNDARKEIERRIAEVDAGAGVVILTDMFGGTPSNISLSFLEGKKIEVITGVNLPMLLKLATYQNNLNLEQLAAFIADYGQRNINLASEVLKKRVDRKKG
jgi:PTS system mannose-specific IIA component